MIDVFLRVHKNKPSESWQRIFSFKNEKHLKSFVEDLSNHKDILNVEVVPLPDRNIKTYNEYLKEHFHAQ